MGKVHLSRDQRLGIHPVNTIKAQRPEHWFVVDTIEVYHVCGVGKMLIIVPCGHTKGVTLLPRDLLVVDDGMPLALYDMIDRRRRFKDGRRGSTLVYSLR